jgi:hypothetical protein
VSFKASRHTPWVHERLCGVWAGQEADVVRTSLLLSSSFLAQGSEHNRGCESQLHGSETVVLQIMAGVSLCLANLDVFPALKKVLAVGW